MAASRQTLPPELIEIIIDHLHNDIHALKACSRVSKSWLPSCRYHLFCSIHLNLSLPTKAHQPFFTHLTHPTSQSYFHTTLRTLSLSNENTAQRRHDLAALAALRGLRTIAISYWYTAMPDPQWFSSARGVSRLEFTCCRIDFPGFAALVRQFPAIETLSFAHVSWQDRFEIDKVMVGGCMLPCLRKLILGRHISPIVPALTALIARGVVVGKVRCMVVDELETRYAEAAGILLRTVGASLRELVISAKTILQNAENAFSLGENTNLESVHFADLVDPCHGSVFMGQFSFDWIIALLKQLPRSVERVVFSIWLIPGDQLGLGGERKDSVDWAKLVPALMHLEGLKSAEFRLRAERAHRAWLRKKCEERFPQLKGVLQVTGMGV